MRWGKWRLTKNLPGEPRQMATGGTVFCVAACCFFPERNLGSRDKVQTQYDWRSV
jgi:hypothetical protein